MTTVKRLQKLVEDIARDIENGVIDCEPVDGEEPTAFDYLQNALAIEYIVSSRKEYLGARIMVACGGPDIWINTRTNTVEGYWGSNAAVAMASALFRRHGKALEELYLCS
jgi:hypothetical protein